jgi:hypothetical protein
MKKQNLFIFSFLFFTISLFAQQNIPKSAVIFNQSFKNIQLKETEMHSYPLTLTKGKLYRFDIFQKGIDVELSLRNEKNIEVYHKDSPNGKNGAETFLYNAVVGGKYQLFVIPLKEDGNAKEGNYDILVKRFSNSEIKFREKTKKELIPENLKTVQTADIDHFWEAFDKLKKCKTHDDSVEIFQKWYIDRATDGFIDFLRVREFTAEEYVQKLAKNSEDYTKNRAQMFEVKKAEPLIQEVFEKFKKIYPNFTPFKVCFAIGTFRTGGTVSDKFVLLGTEMVASGKMENIPQRIKSIVAHECVHTQQKNPDSTSNACRLLYAALNEGSANFISELIAGESNKDAYDNYGVLHETELWKEFKAEMCNENISNWLYNGFTVKDKPADLGYFMGYVISKEYYKNAADKSKAVIEIIEMTNPKAFLEKSGYDKN